MIALGLPKIPSGALKIDVAGRLGSPGLARVKDVERSGWPPACECRGGRREGCRFPRWPCAGAAERAARRSASPPRRARRERLCRDSAMISLSRDVGSVASVSCACAACARTCRRFLTKPFLQLAGLPCCRRGSMPTVLMSGGGGIALLGAVALVGGLALAGPAARTGSRRAHRAS